MTLRTRLERLEERQRRDLRSEAPDLRVRFVAPDGSTTAIFDPQTGRTLPAEQWQALDVLREIGQAELARELGPAGAAEWLARTEAAFDACDCTDDELRRMAGGDDPADVLGAERAAKLMEALDTE